MNWLRMMETTVETKWSWWTLSYETGHWIYLFDNRTNKVIVKIFVWHWELEEELEEKMKND